MFEVDQKVLCIGGFSRRPDAAILPVTGRIYTVRWIGQRCTDNAPCLMLVEHFGGKHPQADIEFAFNVERFRPLLDRETDISVFTEMLKQKEDA